MHLSPLKSLILATFLTTATLQAVDLDKDGNPDLVFQSTQGYLKAWEMDNSYGRTEHWITNLNSTSTKVFSEVGDIDNDGNPDILLQDTKTGYIKALKMNGFSVNATKWIGNPQGANWKIVGTSDIDNNGYPDIIMQNSSNGYIKAFKMGANFSSSEQWIGNPAGTAWKVKGVVDVNNDGIADIIMQNSTLGYIKAFQLNSNFSVTNKWIGNPGGSAWEIKGKISDINGDGIADIVMQHKTLGYIKAFKLNSNFSGTLKWVGNPAGANWKIVSVADNDGDGIKDVVMQNNTLGYVKAFKLNSNFSGTTKWIGNPAGKDWVATEVKDMDGNGNADIVFQHKTLGYVKAFKVDNTFTGTEKWIGSAGGSAWSLDLSGEDTGTSTTTSTTPVVKAYDYTGTWTGTHYVYLIEQPSVYCRWNLTIDVKSNDTATVSAVLTSENGSQGECDSFSNVWGNITNKSDNGFKYTVTDTTSYNMIGPDYFDLSRTNNQLKENKTFMYLGYQAARETSLSKK